jgi:hypothetical protein
MIGDNGIYIGVHHWTHEAALIREFQRQWNKQQIERYKQRSKYEQV